MDEGWNNFTELSNVSIELYTKLPFDLEDKASDLESAKLHSLLVQKNICPDVKLVTLTPEKRSQTTSVIK